MFTRLQRFYNSIKLLADVVTLAVSFGLAWLTRFSGPLPYESRPPTADTLVILSVVLVVFPLTFRQASLYTTNRARSHVGEVFEVFKSTILATTLLVAITFFFYERYSRVTIALFTVYAFIGVSAVRL
ncbi:MAG: undecaprenyl-phosphate glucose phosphotransferase, partial [Myxococcaceae bacterium]|nr:undecaprenyl-phosphate glucose phosphotransferase [Myxococcaceae bacterium]